MTAVAIESPTDWGHYGDKVEVRITEKWKKNGWRLSRLSKRAHPDRCTYQHSVMPRCEPDDRRSSDGQCQPAKGNDDNDGAKGVLLTPADDPRIQLSGKIIEVLGMPGEPGVDVLSIIHQFKLPTSFPRAVSSEAEAIPKAIPNAEITRRHDYRNAVVFTIDPEDAKDHDDAVSLEATESGYRLGVHIADVSYYVREHSHLDKEARTRTSSAYLVDRVLPMLPERLSNDLCSLRENEDRPHVGDTIVKLAGHGNPRRCHRSQASSVRAGAGFLDTGPAYKPGVRTLRLMEELAQKLIAIAWRPVRSTSRSSVQNELDDMLGTHVVRREGEQSHHRGFIAGKQDGGIGITTKNIPALQIASSPNPEAGGIHRFAPQTSAPVSFGLPPQPKFIADFISGLPARTNRKFSMSC
jgi:hypothetical protein